MEEQVEWLIGVLDSGEFDPVEATEHFDPAFLAEIPLAALDAPLGQIAPEGSAPWHEIGEQRDGRVAEITVESATGTRLTMTVALTTDAPHRIEGLLLQPDTGQTREGYTTAQLDADLAAFAPRAAVGIYDVGGGECDVVHERDGERALAIGSVFKLWVLAELANQVSSSTAAWDEPLAVRADLRSNPAGDIYQLADGDTRTLRQYADSMISISDNTATDHLIDRLGRSAVEAALPRAGVARPELNQPFLATRELFWLKFLADAPNPPDWYAADTDGRRAIVEDLQGQTVPWVNDPTLATAPNADGLLQTQPRNLDIEWFASPRDLCRTWIHLDQLAATPGLEPVGDILSMNAGTDLDPETWTDIRFKGGSEPGVFALTWWLRRQDGATFVVVGLLNDPGNPFDQLAATQLIANAIALI
jgi:beta-lactamase class A